MNSAIDMNDFTTLQPYIAPATMSLDRTQLSLTEDDYNNILVGGLPVLRNIWQRIMSSTVSTTNSNVNYIFNKFKLYILPTQFGKTFLTISKIQQQMSDTSIHFIYTMNTLNNNKQYANRLNALSEMYGQNSIVVFACKNNGHPYRHVSTSQELEFLLNKSDFDERPKIVVMCSNSYKFNDIMDADGVIQELDKKINDRTSYYDAIYPIFDELHKYINDGNTRKIIQNTASLHSVKEIIATSATPGKIWIAKEDSLWHDFVTVNLSEMNEQDYCGVRDQTWCIIDEVFNMKEYKKPSVFEHDRKYEDVIKFIKHVFENCSDILNDESYWFIPGSHIRKSHNEIQRLCLEKNPKTVIFVFNGERKEMVFKNASGIITNISLEEPNDIGELPALMYSMLDKYCLLSRPRVITGHVCISMGQTLCNEAIGNFTHAIISGLDLDNDEVYQLVGRIFTRCKSWSTYNATEIYCPSITKDISVAMERAAKAELLSYDENGKRTLDTYLGPANEYIKNCENSEFITNNFSKSKEKKDKKPKREKPNESNYTRDFCFSDNKDNIHKRTLSLSSGSQNIDYTRNSTLDENGRHKIHGPGCQAGQKKVYYIEELYDHAFNKSLGSHLDTKINTLEIGKTSKRRYICYENKDDPNSIVYCLISVTRVSDGCGQTHVTKKILNECRIN